MTYDPPPELDRLSGGNGRGVLENLCTVTPVLAAQLADIFGAVFDRMALGSRERQLLTLAVLTALGAERPLRFHVEASLRAGVLPEEIVVVAEHAAVYAGFPRAMDLVALLREMAAQGRCPLPAPARPVRLHDHETLLTDTGGDGPPLVLVHCVGLDRQVWRDAIPPLATKYRVLAHDLRGHGWAAGAPGVDSVEQLADDLAALLDRLGLDRAHVAGLSLGGAVAQAFAVRHGRRLASLALVCTMARGLPVFLDRAAALEHDGVEPQVVPTLLRWFTPEHLAENGWGVRYARQRLLRSDAAAQARAWRALARIDFAGTLGGLGVPVRLIAGDGDVSSTPEMMRAMADAIPGAAFHVIDGGTHLLPLVKPLELAARLLEDATP